MNDNASPRLLSASLARAARVMPVVVITGARQTGKSTLVRDLLAGDRSYFTLDDLDVRAQAERAPADLLARAASITLDEVQRSPEVLSAVKKAVDERRTPGRFILTGSANLLMMRRVSESLAGRAAYLVLQPFTRREIMGSPACGPWSALFDTPGDEWEDLLAGQEYPPEPWRECVARGGYPVPALELKRTDERAVWFEGYVQTYLERDLQDIASIDNLIDFRRLMRAAAHRIGQQLNQTELGRDVQLAQPTVRRWLNLLETSYQLVRLPAYAVNRTKRLVKTPKLYWSDPGLALHLANETEPRGADLENLVLADLLAWRGSLLQHRPEIFWWRTVNQEEVDFVIEIGTRLLAIEVKATSRPRASDADHLRAFRAEYGKRVHGCLLLHTGREITRLGEGMLAVPWWRVL